MKRPLSFNVGYDGEMIDTLLSVHHPCASPRILDVTCNKGRIWKHSIHKPSVCTDLKPYGNAQASFLALPFISGAFDVVIFDPPHIPNDADSANGSKLHVTKYGLDANNPLLAGDNVAPVWQALTELGRVVNPTDGIILVKIADLIHQHRYQWQHVDLINAAHAQKFTVCDMGINVHPSGMRLSGAWKTVQHVRRAHVYWFVIRPHRRCHSRHPHTVTHKPQTLELFGELYD